MYSPKQKEIAVQLLIRYDFAYTQVIRELGYPNSKTTLRKWLNEYDSNGHFKEKYGRKSKYSDFQKEIAVNYYLEHGKNISRTVRKLGYPSRPLLMQWIDELAPDQKQQTKAGGVVVKYTQHKKKEAVLDFSMREGSAQEIADSHQVSRVSLYKWSQELLSDEGYEMVKGSNKKETNELKELKEEKQALLDNLKQLKQENERLRFENDILEKAGEILKKQEGINLLSLSNHEKMLLINALRNKYPLKRLLKRLNLAKSSYFYQMSALTKTDKYKNLRQDIKGIFHTSYEAYGYRRIHLSLRNNGMKVSEKVVRKLMSQEGLVVSIAHKRKYKSYLGEISPAVKNLLKRDFFADLPNEKWVTDVSEFSIPAGKIYLSPIIDCFDGLPVSWNISTSPNAQLTNTMLDYAVTTLKPNEHPILHSDCGGHYRWPSWIDRMGKAELIRSMSKKGCSPDNARCEGFFGTIKQEMFYSRNWAKVTVNQFINYLDQYLVWYSKDRIKCSLKGMSPINYRKSLGIQI